MTRVEGPEPVFSSNGSAPSATRLGSLQTSAGLANGSSQANMKGGRLSGAPSDDGTAAGAGARRTAGGQSPLS